MQFGIVKEELVCRKEVAVFPDWKKFFDTEHPWTPRVRDALENTKAPWSSVSIAWFIKAELCHFALGVIITYAIMKLLMRRNDDAPNGNRPAAAPDRKRPIAARIWHRLWGWILRNPLIGGGLISLFVDIDHPSIILLHHPSGRMLHPWFLIAAVIGAVYYTRRIVKLHRTGINAYEEIIKFAMCFDVIAHIVQDFVCWMF